MKRFVSVFFLFLLLIPKTLLSYEIKWLRDAPELNYQDEGSIKMHTTSAYLLSKYIPVKKVVSIVDLEIKKIKKDKENFCTKNFFPAEELGFKKNC